MRHSAQTVLRVLAGVAVLGLAGACELMNSSDSDLQAPGTAPCPDCDPVEEMPLADGQYQWTLVGSRADTGDPDDWWYDTGVAVGAGDTLTVACTGGIRPQPGSELFDCDGDPDKRWALALAGTRCDFASLVGKIGAEGTPFCLGASAELVAPAGAQGQLYLGVNDGERFVDNSGSWQVRANIERAHACGGGGWRDCSPECPCSPGQGDCDDDADCVPGAVCLHDTGRCQAEPNCETGDICDRFDACLATDSGDGLDWSLSNPNWHFTYDDASRCHPVQDGGPSYPVTDRTDRMQRLIRSVQLGSSQEYDSAQDAQACSILQEALALCRGGTFVPAEDLRPMSVGATEPQVPRVNLCHPGAKVSCGPEDRHQPDFGVILETANRSPSVAIEPAPETYCTGQTVAGQGYATTRPAPGEVQWQCTDNDEQDLADVQPLGFSGAGGLDCRVRKALVECVEPNLLRIDRSLSSIPCTLYKPAGERDDDPDGDGVIELSGRRFTATNDPAMANYCISIVLGEGSGDHASRLAIDFNDGVFSTDGFDPAEQYDNSGNITDCVGASSDTCSNTRYTPRVDLPPVLVSIMEGCGFEWRGRADAAEGGYLGCDPMHFELPQ